MLEDGHMVDSARLPRDAIQEEPITVPADRLVQIINSEAGVSNSQPLTYSQESASVSRQLPASHALEASNLPPQEVHYHPVHVSDMQSLVESGSLAGSLLPLRPLSIQGSNCLLS